MSSKCEKCGALGTPSDIVCPGCGSLYTLVDAETAHVPVRYSRLVRASDVEQDPLERISTGCPGWDHAYDGGIVFPCSTLVFGEAGVGKTTALCRISSVVAEGCDGDALYISSEMPIDMVAHSARRAGALLDRLLISDSSDLDMALEDVDEADPSVVVFDSLQAFRIDGEAGEKVLSEVVSAAVSCAREGRIVFLISQVTKTEDFAGHNGIRHDADAVLRMYRGAGGIMLEMQKHRYGVAPRTAQIPDEKSKGPSEKR